MIAIVYPQFYGVGGIARYLDSFLSNLPSDHPPIVLITGDQNRTERTYSGVDIIHVPITSNRLGLLIWSLRVRTLLTKLFADGRIQWINFHFPPLIPGLFLPRNIPIALTAHTTYLGMSGRFYKTHHFKSQWHRLSLSIKSWMEHRIFSRTTQVISLTEQGKQEVIVYGFKGPIYVIPNGVDIRLFTPDNTEMKDFDVIFSGRIEQRKGSRTMVELCQQLVTKKSDIRICIVGYGDDELYVRKELNEIQDNVTFTGKIPFAKMTDYYNRSRIYVSTSYYEGLPGTCLEAMAMQLPAVVWDFLFYKKLVIEEETGFLISPNDIETMIDKIIRLLENNLLATRIGINARNLLVTDYNWSMLSKTILDTFQNES